MRAVNKHVEAGETVKLASLESVRVEAAGSGANIHGVEHGDSEEYVVVKTACEDRRTLEEWPDETQVLGVTDGSGMQSAQVFGLIPVEVYSR